MRDDGPVSPPPPGHRADAVRNRQQILGATRLLVSRDGGEVSMEAIAAEAGVAVGTLYRHFPTKDALLRAVVEEKLQALSDELVAASARVGAGGSAWRELSATFLAVVHRQAGDRAVKAAVALAQRPGDATVEAEQRVRTLLEELVAAAHHEGSLRPDLSADDIGWLLQGLPGDEVDEATRNRCAQVVLDGLRAGARLG